VKSGDTCLGIAAFFEISVQSIVTLNNLPATCDTLFENQPLLIPQPTATPTSLPTATLSSAEQTEAACEKINYEVQSSDTLGSISANFGVPMAAIRDYNGLTGDTVFLGQVITIPLCRRFATPGPTPTETPPPPYPAPNLLLPVDGAPFTFANDSVNLQWAAVGTLRDDEAYQVTVEDITLGEGKKLIEYVTDTKFIVPGTLRPADSLPHVFRWSVAVFRQSGTDDSGNPIWVSAGASSLQRDFTWSGVSGAATPTP
jgi:LysM repeat protein